jgi:hypothetical protein
MKRSRATASEVAALKANFHKPFHVLDADGDPTGEERIFCKHCDADIVNNTTKMRSHINSTCKVLNNRLSEGNGFLSSRGNSSSLSRASTPLSTNSSLVFVGSGWNNEKRDRFQYKLGKAVILGGRPFNLLNDKLFEDAFKELPFNFQPASAAFVGNDILTHLHVEIQHESMSLVINAPSITLSTDGWSDRHHNGIHNLMICTPRPFYYSRVKQLTDKADADYIFNIFESGRKSILGEFTAAKKDPPFLFAYLSDSTNVMRAARVKNPDVIGYGCPSHALNNFSKDVANNPIILRLIQIVSSLHQFFRISHRPLAFLHKCMKTHLGKTVHLPSLGKTRFASIDTLLSVCSAVKPAFVAYASYGLTDETFDCPLPSKLQCCVQSQRFWYSIAASTQLTHKIMYAIKYLEGDTVPASTNVAAFLFMKLVLKEFSSMQDNAGFRDALDFDSTELRRLNDCIDRRWLRICHPVLYLAFMLDPLFIQLRRDGITTLGGKTVQIEAMDALNALVDLKIKSVGSDSGITKDPDLFRSKIIQQYSNFMIAGPTNPLLIANQHRHPIVTWGLLMAYWPDLATHIALPVSALVASPSGGERNFKVASRVDSDTRFRLGEIKTDKQIACVYNYHQIRRFKEDPLPDRDGTFILMFKSLNGAYSEFNENDMAQYELLMSQQTTVFPANPSQLPRQDLNLAVWEADDSVPLPPAMLQNTESDSDSERSDTEDINLLLQ